MGLSNKENKTPLDPTTQSGKLIDEIIDKINYTTYKTNLCNFVPFNKNGKLRYPTQKEMDSSMCDLINRLTKNNCNIVFLLGGKVTKTIERYYNVKIKDIYKYENFTFVSVQHPSYIMVYKKKFKEDYIHKIVNIINDLENRRNTLS